MAKPAITLRSTKGSVLTATEVDTNFTNLQNATVTVAGDSGSTATDLNGTVTVAGGTGLTSSVSGSTLTLNLDNTAVTAGSYTLSSITVDAQGRITSASNGTAGSSGPSMAILTMAGNGVVVSDPIYRTTFTEVSDPSGIVSLTDSNRRFILGAGTYAILSDTAIFTVAENRPSETHILYNITSSSTLVSDIAIQQVGTSGNYTFAYHPQKMVFTLASSTTIEYRFNRSTAFYLNQHLDVFYIYKLA